MNLTKRVVAGVLVLGLLAAVLGIPQPAEARGRHGGGHFWGGLAVGALTGLVVGSVFAPRVYAAPPVVYTPVPPVIYQPAPVVVQPPPVVYQPACSSYWVDTYWNGYQWVPGHWTQVCR
jgi:hypothetical protein